MEDRGDFKTSADTSDHRQPVTVVSSGEGEEERLWCGQHDTTVEVVGWAHDRAMTEDQDKDKLSQRQSGRTQLGGRVLRNRKYRRPFDDNRQTKRLFTPEIKKFLKDWLVRRRDHPYPNRDEKKRLAVQTGLTYIQICNWFANWRRKLKNAGQETRTTWGNLIKNYNTQAQGNVEQFSISSDDSIWERPGSHRTGGDGEESHEAPRLTYTANATAMDHSYSAIQNKTAESDAQDDKQPQCFQVTSTTTEEEDARQDVSLSTGVADDFPTQTSAHTLEDDGGCPGLHSLGSMSTSKYKSHIMEKYLRDLQLEPSQSDDVEAACPRRVGTSTPKESVPHSSTTTMEEDIACTEETNMKLVRKTKSTKKTKDSCPPPALSKWLESAAKFRPTKCYVPWSVSKSDAWHTPRCRVLSKRTHKPIASVDQESTPKLETGHWVSKGHQREELDAAEALTRLSGLQQ